MKSFGHGVGELHPLDRHPFRCQRDCDSPSPGGELKGSPSIGDLGEEPDGVGFIPASHRDVALGGPIPETLLDQIEVTGQVLELRVAVAREFVADIAHYEAQRKTSLKRLRSAVAATGTSLTDIRGIGVVNTAIIIGHVGNIDRFASSAHFASYNATAPIEASSGENRRHRLNQRGNRQLNYAIHIAAITQLRQPCEGRVYFDRKRAEGKNPKEAIRALKRQISNAVYRALVVDARRSQNA